MSAIRRGSFLRSSGLETPPRSIPSQDFLNRDQPLTQASFSSSLAKRRFDQANLVSQIGKKGDLVHSLQLPKRANMETEAPGKQRFQPYFKRRRTGNSSCVSSRLSQTSGPEDLDTSASTPICSATPEYNELKRTQTEPLQKPSMNTTGPNEYHEYSKEEFVPGTIIRASLHEEDFRRTPRTWLQSRLSNIGSTTSKSVTHSDRFGAIYSENRPMIVVATYSQHYVAIPLFTYSGNGLAHKENPGEYASIEDHRAPSSLRQAPYLLSTGHLKSGVPFFSPQCNAHLAYPVSRLYKLPVRHLGRLGSEDTKLLVVLFNKLMANPLTVGK